MLLKEWVQRLVRKIWRQGERLRRKTTVDLGFIRECLWKWQGGGNWPVLSWPHSWDVTQGLGHSEGIFSRTWKHSLRSVQMFSVPKHSSTYHGCASHAQFHPLLCSGVGFSTVSPNISSLDLCNSSFSSHRNGGWRFYLINCTCNDSVTFNILWCI